MKLLELRLQEDWTYQNAQDYFEKMGANSVRTNPTGGYNLYGNIQLVVPYEDYYQYDIKRVNGNFSIEDTKYTTLDGGPEEVTGDFSCVNTPITSLEGSPKKVGGNFYCYNTEITNLNGVSPYIGGNIELYDTKVTTMTGIHKTHKDWIVKGSVWVPDDCTNLLSLSQIPGVNSVTYDRTEFDVSHHDLHQFQEQLLDAGFKEQARL